MLFTVPHTKDPIVLDLLEADGVHIPSSKVTENLQCLDIGENESFLDLGCGCGIYGLYAAKTGCREVTMIDVCPLAVEAARQNAERNGIHDATFGVGDFFEPADGGRFDVIVANLPQTPAPRPMQADKWGGPTGTKHLMRLAREAADHLNEGGRLYFFHISLAHPSAVHQAFQHCFELEVLYQHSRIYQRAEYEAYQEGLFDYLMTLREQGLAEFEPHEDAWAFHCRFLRATLR